MALHGTLDTFALADVMQLLAVTAKSGCLHLEADDAEGFIWVSDGSVVGIRATHAGDRAEPAEVMYELTQLGRGSFAFRPGEKPDAPFGPVPVDTLLDAAATVEAEWAQLRAAVPRLDVAAHLVRDLGRDEVTIDSAQWRELYAVVSSGSLAEAGEQMRLSNLATARAVNGLLRAGLVTLEGADAGASEPSAATPAEVEQPGIALAEEASRTRRVVRPARAETDATQPVSEPPSPAPATPAELVDDDLGIRFDLADEPARPPTGTDPSSRADAEDLAAMSPRARAALAAMDDSDLEAGDANPSDDEDATADESGEPLSQSRASLMRFLSSTKA